MSSNSSSVSNVSLPSYISPTTTSASMCPSPSSSLEGRLVYCAEGPDSFESVERLIRAALKDPIDSKEFEPLGLQDLCVRLNAVVEAFLLQSTEDERLVSVQAQVRRSLKVVREALARFRYGAQAESPLLPCIWERARLKTKLSCFRATAFQSSHFLTTAAKTL